MTRRLPSYKEALRQYPNNSSGLAAQDQLGECYHKMAEQAQRKMLAAPDDNTRIPHQNSRQHWLEEGAKVYEAMADELEHKARRESLPPVEMGLLRKALFGTADLRFEMNEFGEALRRFENLQEKYRKQVEGLIACKRVWDCVGVMFDTPAQANRAKTAAIEAVKKAKADLESMPEDSEAFRGGNGVWTRTNWQNYFRWVDDKLNNPSGGTPRPTAIN